MTNSVFVIGYVMRKRLSRVNLYAVTGSNRRKDIIIKYEKFWKHQESNSQHCRKLKRFWSILPARFTSQYESCIHNNLNSINRWIEVCCWMRNINYHIFTYFWVRFGVDLIFHFTWVSHQRTWDSWSSYSILTKTEVRKRSSCENVETLQFDWNNA